MHGSRLMAEIFSGETWLFMIVYGPYAYRQTQIARRVSHVARLDVC